MEVKGRVPNSPRPLNCFFVVRRRRIPRELAGRAFSQARRWRRRRRQRQGGKRNNLIRREISFSLYVLVAQKMKGLIRLQDMVVYVCECVGIRNNAILVKTGKVGRDPQCIIQELRLSSKFYQKNQNHATVSSAWPNNKSAVMSLQIGGQQKMFEICWMSTFFL